MKKCSLPVDDLPPEELTSSDWVLSQKLEASLNQFFYAACQNVEGADERRSLTSLLSQCQWYITTKPQLTTLVIHCPDASVNWRVLEKIVPIAILLERFAIRLMPRFATGKICVYPPSDAAVPLEVRVDELDVYQQS